mmetsp:Transcript_103498/g.297379  ORF Transcript_103498/g.297379 Transcript_103498/m.297379 type:complete len:118 (+) Transcript_103498:717-1070(+)
MGIVGALLVEGEGTIDDEEEAMERRAVIWASADEEEALEGRAVILAPRRTRGVLASTGRISRPAIEAEQARRRSVGACRAARKVLVWVRSVQNKPKGKKRHKRGRTFVHLRTHCRMF